MALLIDTVQIELKPIEAALFIEFQRHHDQIVKLLRAKAFDIRNGSFVVHLDGNGQVRKVDRHDALYQS